MKEIKTKKGELKTAYKKVLREINGTKKGEKIYLKSWNGSYKNLSLNDTKYNNCIDLFNILKIKYVIGNSKKGGTESDYIEITRNNKFTKIIKNSNMFNIVENIENEIKSEGK